MDNSLQQYLDLFANHKDLIFSKSSPGFNSVREKAFESSRIFGLPARGAENYEVTDLSAMLAPDYGLNIARIPLDVDPAQGFKCGLPQLTSSLFFMLNDRWAESKDARRNLPEGIEIGPLSSFLVSEENEYYGRLADIANPIVALNTMFVQEGMYIRVKKGVRIDRPIQLVNLLHNTLPLMTFRRIVIILEEDSALKFLNCSHSSTQDVPLASVSVAEIFVAKNARFDFYDMEESGSNTSRLTALYLSQEEGSDVLIDNFTLHNGKTRNEYHCKFKGSNGNLRLYGLGIEGKESVLDNYSHIRHEVPACHTEELFKYIVEDEARGAFTGRIYVAPGAYKTQAYQSNRNLVSSDKARMFSQPQLEIYNDDVKCSHGAATGQLDTMQLFYLRSRGLDEAEARFLLKQAFMADVIDEIRLPLLRDRLHSLIEKRLSGQDLSCGECEACGAQK